MVRVKFAVHAKDILKKYNLQSFLQIIGENNNAEILALLKRMIH